MFRYPETLEGKEFGDFLEQINPKLYNQIRSISKLREIAEKVFGDLEGLEVYLDLQKESEEEAMSNDHS